MTGSVTTPVRPRVVVISLAYKLPPRVQAYVRELIGAGADVDLLVAYRASTEEADIDPRVRVLRVADTELDLPVRRVEHFVVYGFWTRAFGRVRSVTARPALQKVDAGLAFARRGQKKVSRAVHRKMFWPVFRVMRPWLLARRGRAAVAGIDVAGADRIVAADTHAVPLAWRLARRHPGIAATTALDVTRYARTRPVPAGDRGGTA